MKNPVFLWAHRSGEPPIGKTVELKKETNPPALVQTIEFASKDVYPFADTVFRLYKGGFLRAVSVGFWPLENPKRIKDENDETVGYEFTNQELLELSAVPIPANAEALARCVQKGFDTRDLERVFSGAQGDKEPNVDRELGGTQHRSFQTLREHRARDDAAGARMARGARPNALHIGTKRRARARGVAGGGQAGGG